MSDFFAAFPRLKQNRPALAAIFLVAGAVLGAVWSFGLGGPAKPRAGGRDEAVPVLAAVAGTKPMAVRINTFGRVQAVASVALRARIDGVIAAVLVKEGQDVAAGAPLFTLDDRQAKAQLRQAEGALARDHAQRDNAQRDLDRLAPLAEKNFASRQQIDQARAALAALEGSVVADEAQVENYKVQLSYTTMTAPIAGRVGSISSKLGNAIRAMDATLLTINQLSPIYVALSLPQGDLPGLQDAMRSGPVAISVTIPGQDAAPETGVISFVENAVDAATNTVGVKATVANATERLWPGQFVEVTITLRTDPAAVVVPVDAVQTGPNGAFVFVIGKDEKVTMRPIEVSRTTGGDSVIKTGLASGERVVTSGQLALVPGSKVRVKAEAGAAEIQP